MRAIREALGMTAPQLARRLGTTRQAIGDLERREVLGTVTLGALRRAADALDCDVVYALVPRTDLRAMRTRQARRQAERQLGSVAHSMRLEAQDVAAGEHRQQVAERTDGLLRTWSRTVWDDVG
jgi:predicted DNA-binding mobile mystery protein A